LLSKRIRSYDGGLIPLLQRVRKSGAGYPAETIVALAWFFDISI
jgi:hypothetical protein